MYKRQARGHPSVDGRFRSALARDPEERQGSCNDFIRALATVGMTPVTGVTRPVIEDSGEVPLKREVEEGSRHDTLDDQVPLESGTRASVLPGTTKPDSATG